MIEVRDARADDAPAVADAHVTAWQVAYRGLIPDDVLDHPSQHEARLAGWTRRLRDGPPPGAGDPDNRIVVAVLDHRVVGFGHAGAEAAPPAGLDHRRGEVYGFYLHPDAWGSGAADELMTVCLDELRSRGFDAAVLWVLRENPRARRFYERHRWVPTGYTLSWSGPAMPGLPALTQPVDQTQYAIDLTA